MRRCIPNSDDALPDPATGFPPRSTTTRSTSETSILEAPEGVTRIVRSLRRADTLPSPPAIKPRAYNRRQTRTIARRNASSTTTRSRLASMDDLSVDDGKVDASLKSLAGVRRVTSLGTKTRGVHGPFRGGIEDCDVSHTRLPEG